jgi:tetratricopeptide (TPR) repeat protein
MAFNARQFTPEVCQAVFHYHDRRGDWDALKNACQTVIVLRKEGVLFSAYTSKAQALAELGRGDEALATLAEMDTRFDWTAEGKLQVKLNRIRILNVLNQSETALTTAKALLAMVSTPAEQTRVRYVLADCYFALDKPQDGERVLREVLDEDPDDVLALNNLGYNLADQGRKLAEAEAMIRRAMALDADRRAREGNPIVESGIYLDSLGWVQFRRGDFVGAKRTFENALSHTEAKADAVVWDHAGDVAWRLKDKDKAVVYWTKAAELYSLRHTGRLHGRLDETKRKLDLAKSPKPPTTRPK